MNNRLWYSFLIASLLLCLAWSQQAFPKEPQAYFGNGFAVAPDVVATAAHVISNKDTVGPIHGVINGVDYEMVLIEKDVVNDVALLRIFALEPLTPAVLAEPIPGEKIALITIYDAEIRTTVGVLEHDDTKRFNFKFTATVCDGMSGGAVVNKQFEVIGLLSARRDVGPQTDKCSSLGLFNSSKHIIGLMTANLIQGSQDVKPFTVVLIYTDIKE